MEPAWVGKHDGCWWTHKETNGASYWLTGWSGQESHKGGAKIIFYHHTLQHYVTQGLMAVNEKWYREGIREARIGKQMIFATWKDLKSGFRPPLDSGHKVIWKLRGSMRFIMGYEINTWHMEDQSNTITNTPWTFQWNSTPCFSVTVEALQNLSNPT